MVTVATICFLKLTAVYRSSWHDQTSFVLFLDVVLYEDQWIGETVLQSTLTSQLLNLGSYSYVQPEKCKTGLECAVLGMLFGFKLVQTQCEHTVDLIFLH